MRPLSSLCSAAAGLWLGCALAPVLLAQGNVLMLMADDVGVDKIGAYGEGSMVPATPNIDALAAGGVRFKTCWANATSSTTRATVLTGRYSFRTGIGYLVLQDTSTPALSLSETILPEVFDLGTPGSYAHASIGKWHLGNFTVGGDAAPNLAGFGHFSGILTNMEGTENYSNWLKTENGVSAFSPTYITTDQVDEALAFVNTQTGSWYCQVWFWAGHAPYEPPPTALCGCTLPHWTPRSDGCSRTSRPKCWRRPRSSSSPTTARRPSRRSRLSFPRTRNQRSTRAACACR
jgi:arylsulfatase A-like enzyme